MTQISAYGIGAGRTIAGESDSDEERLRQRRVSAAQRADQEKRGALVRERLARAQAAEAVLSDQQQAQRMQAEAKSREAQPEARQKSPMFPVPARPAPTHEPLAAAAPKPGQRADKPMEAMPQPVPVDAPLAPPKSRKPLAVESGLRQGEREEDKLPEAVHPVVPAADSVPETETPQVQRFTRLIDDVTDLRGENFSDQLAARLNDLALSIRSQPELLTEPADVGKALAALEFLEGYVEAANPGALDQQKILQSISDVRRQMVESGLSPQLPQVMASALVANQIPVDKGRVSGVTDTRGQGRQRLPASERNAGADPDDEAESSLLAGGVQAMLQSSAGAVKPSKSSLSKDAEKRREETLVSVTVRSV